MKNAAKRALSLILVVMLMVSAVAPAALAGEDSPETEQKSIPTQEITEAQQEEETQPEDPAPMETSDTTDAVFLNYGTASAKGYATLAAAVSAASDGDTLTVASDLALTERLSISKSLTITDDGNAHTISIANTSETGDSSNGYGRGIQVNSGKTVTIRGTEAGKLTLCGQVEESANTGYLLYSYNGTLVLENLTVTGCKGSGAVYGFYSSKYSGNVTIRSCTFTDNAESSGGDVYISGSAKLTLGGDNVIPRVYTALGTTIDVTGTWTENARIGLALPEAKRAENTQILSGESMEQSYGCITVTDLVAPYCIDPTGKIAERPVAKRGGVYYTTLKSALQAASTGDTVTVISDIEITEKLYISNDLTAADNLTIQDDGRSRTIYFANTSDESTNGRGIQIGGGKTVTIRGTAAGKLILCGHGTGDNAETYNRDSMLVSYNGTLVLENLTVTGCRQETGYGAVYGYYKADTATGNVTLVNCTFTDNALPAKQTSGADVLVNGSAVLTLSGCNTVPDVYCGLESPIVVTGTWTGAEVGLTVPASEENNKLVAGTPFLTGESIQSAFACLTVAGLDTDHYYVDGTGNLAERPVARIGDTEYLTLKAAVEAASTGDTIVLIADAFVDSAIEISNASDSFVLKITDDGDPHTIYIYNSGTGSSNRYGRGIEIKKKAIVTIEGTRPGNLTLVGHSKDGTRDNYSAALYVYRGTLTLKNITLKECRSSLNGAIYTYNDYYEYSAGKYSQYTGTLNLNNCVIEDNTCKSNSTGAAICNQGIVNVYGGTVIRNNYSRWSKGGGIYNDVHTSYNGTKDVTLTGVTNLSGSVTVTGNMKGCSVQENTGVNPDGKSSDIYATVPANIKDSTTGGSIGIDYGGEGAQFGTTTASTGVVMSRFFSNNSDAVDAIREGTGLFWREYSTIDPGEASQGEGRSYSLSACTVSVPSGDTGAALTVTVDRGQFSVDWTLAALTSLGVTKTYFIDADGVYGTADGIPTARDLLGVTIEAPWTADLAQSFLRSLVFSGDTDGMKQTVTLGLAETVEEGSVYFGGSAYRYVETGTTYANAVLSAEMAGGQLAVIGNAVTDKLLTGRFGGAAGYIGGQLLSDNWYWTSGRLEGTRITVSSTGTQGYENGYTNWADSQPGTGNVMVLEDGKWSAADGTVGRGYYVETEDGTAAAVTTEIMSSRKKNSLASISLELESGVAVNYYLTFTDALANSEESYVTVTVGEREPVRFDVKDILKPENKSAYGSSYKITVPVSAKEMNAPTEIRFYGGSGRFVGSVGGAGKTQYNVCWYAANVILKKDSGDSYNPNYSRDLIALVKALLNYGAAAQTQFAYDTENLANADYEDTTALTASDTITEGTVTFGEGKQYYIELIADSTTVIRVWPDTTAEFAATVDGAAAEVITASDRRYVDIPLSVDQLTRYYSVVFSGGFEDTLTLNAAGVIKAMLTDGTDVQKETCDKLYKLSKAANSFFGVYTPAADLMESILNTAYAYLEKTEYIQYDQRSMTTNDFVGHANSRRQTDASPSDATARNTVYMDCSSFCYNVYREVFGREATLLALGGKNADETDMVTAQLRNCSTGAGIATYTVADGIDFAAFRASLQPGDLIIKYRPKQGDTDAHGHIVLWTGSGYIHCTGSSYNYTTGKDVTEESGAIFYVPGTEFNEYWYNGFTTVTVLRPLNVLGETAVTEAAQGRQQLGPVAVSKTATVGGVGLYNGRSVVTGDTVSYTITLENRYEPGTVNTARTVNVTDLLPEGTTLVTANGAAVSGSKLIWANVTIPVGGTVGLTYTVTVTAAAGTTLAPTSGTVVSAEAGENAGAVSFSSVNSISVEKAVDAGAVDALVAKAEGYVGSKAANGLTVLNDILDAGVSGASLCDSDSAWMSALLTNYKSYYYVKSFSTSTAPGRYLVGNFIGGRRVWNYSSDGLGQFDTHTRLRNLTVDNLAPGDVIAVKNDDTYTYYVYESATRMVKLETGSTVTLLSDSTVSSTLSSLLAKDFFAVFRILGRA